MFKFDKYCILSIGPFVFFFFLNNVLDTVCTCCGAMGYLMLVCMVSGPINREMRNLISSLKNHNEQLKGEVSRYRRKLRETQIEVNKVCI